MRHLVRGGVYLRVEDNLGDAVAVPQVNENEAAVIPAFAGPADEGNRLACVTCAKFAAVSRPAYAIRMGHRK
jgi:hypothetical protein